MSTSDDDTGSPGAASLPASPPDWRAHGTRWVSAGLIDTAQLDAIVAFEARQVAIPQPGTTPVQLPARPKKALDLGTITMYVGGFLILFALTIFVGAAWDDMARGTQFFTALLAVGGLGSLGWWLRYRAGIDTGGNLLIFAATGAVPLLVYTFQRLLGIWSGMSTLTYERFYERIRPEWVSLEVIAIGVAIAVVIKTRFPLIMLLIAFWGWYLAMDLGRFLLFDSGRSFGRTDSELWFGAFVGFLMTAIAVSLYTRNLRPLGMWLALFGGISLVDYLGWLGVGRDDPVAGVLFPIAAVAFIVVSVWLQARVFLVVGAIALYFWVARMVFDRVDDTSSITFALVLIGLLIVGSGILYQKKIEPWLESLFARHRQQANAADAPTPTP